MLSLNHCRTFYQNITWLILKLFQYYPHSWHLKQKISKNEKQYLNELCFQKKFELLQAWSVDSDKTKKHWSSEYFPVFVFVSVIVWVSFTGNWKLYLPYRTITGIKFIKFLRAAPAYLLSLCLLFAFCSPWLIYTLDERFQKLGELKLWKNDSSYVCNISACGCTFSTLTSVINQFCVAFSCIEFWLFKI